MGTQDENARSVWYQLRPFAAVDHRAKESRWVYFQAFAPSILVVLGRVLLEEEPVAIVSIHNNIDKTGDKEWQLTG